MSTTKRTAVPTRSMGKVQPTAGAALGISLNEAHRRLVKELKDRAPARITLHRHSSSGALKHLVVRDTGSRQYYDATRLIAYYRSGMGRTTPAAATRSPTAESIRSDLNDRSSATPGGPGGQVLLPADPEASKVIIETVLNEVLPTIRATQSQAAQEMASQVTTQITTALEPLKDLLTRVHDQLADLSKTRQTLMIKYDAEANLTAQRLANAEAEVKRLRTGDNDVLTMVRMQADLSRMHDTLKTLHTLIGDLASKGTSR